MTEEPPACCRAVNLEPGRIVSYSRPFCIGNLHGVGVGWGAVLLLVLNNLILMELMLLRNCSVIGVMSCDQH